MKTNIISDLSTLTTINESSLERLFNKINWCICDNIEKTIDNDENIAEIDLGFGTLVIFISEDSVQYRFKPSKELENGVNSTIVDEHNPLVLAIENNLVKKITEIYKELL